MDLCADREVGTIENVCVWSSGEGKYSPINKESTISRMVKEYPKVKPDARFWTEDGCMKAFEDLDLLNFVTETSRMDTSPGLPWVGLGCPTIGDVIRKYPHQLVAAVRERLDVRLKLPIGEAKLMSPSELVKIGYRDVVRVFVKQEPHSESKIVSGRVRLIMNTSLTDILCDRLCLEALANREVDMWDKIPSKAGMGLDDENIELLRAGVPPGHVFSSDAKAFDFHVAEWTMEIAAEVEVLQYDVAESSDLAHLIHASVVATCRKVWALANGLLYEQLDPGKQESGSRMTACRNSKIRSILAYLAGANWVCAMGDDALERWPGDVFDPHGNYAKLGHRIEVPDLPPGVLYEFCSTHFMEDGANVPQGWPKTFYRLLGHKPDLLLRKQFEYELRDSPELPRLREFCDRVWK